LSSFLIISALALKVWLNTGQPLLPLETCTKSQTPVWCLMPDYWTCRISAWPDYRDVLYMYTCV
jgi:hypothetical protein